MLKTEQQPNQLQQRLSQLSPVKKITEQQVQVKQLNQRLVYAMQNSLQQRSESFVHAIEQLQLVSPLATIARGYSVTRNVEQQVICSVTQLTIDDEITVQVTDGLIKAKVI